MERTNRTTTARSSVHESKSKKTRQTSKGVHQKHHKKAPNPNGHAKTSGRVQLPNNHRGTPTADKSTSKGIHRGVHRRTQRDGQREENPNHRRDRQTDAETVRRRPRRRGPNQVRPNSTKNRSSILVQTPVHSTHTRRRWTEEKTRIRKNASTGC